jgi:hypothetical protein
MTYSSNEANTAVGVNSIEWPVSRGFHVCVRSSCQLLVTKVMDTSNCLTFRVIPSLGRAWAGVGYAFKWGDVILDYRYLYYSQDSGKAIRPLVVSAK